MNQQITSEGKTFFIIDGSSYIYRAFYAIRRLTNSRGMATQAVHGFVTMLQKVMRERRPEYICVVFDAPGPNFRHEMYEAYKATRQVTPEELIAQIPYIKKAVRYLGVPQMELEGYEADDLIATLTHWASARGLEIVVVSGDKDLHQLIQDPAVRQWDPQNDRVFTELVVLERFGVAPGQMVDYLALVGDTTDNIPGVKGVGEKTASQLLKKWGSLDGIYTHLNEISPDSLRHKLSAGNRSAYLSRELVSLRLDVLIDKGLEEFAPAPPMRQEMFRLCEELELKTILDMLRRQWAEPDEVKLVSPEPSRRKRADRIIRTREELVEMIRIAETKSLIAIEIETTSQNAMDADLVSIALCWDDSGAWYIPVGHNRECGIQMTAAEALHGLDPILSARTVGKAGHDLKFQWMVLKRYGINLETMIFDTMIASYLLDPGGQTHAIERICAEHLGEAICSYEDLTGRGKGQVSFVEIDFEKAVDYACRIVETCWRLVPVLRRKLEENKLKELYESIELPLTEVLARMEYTGILVDSEKLEELSIGFEKALDQKAALIYQMAGEEFNIQSPKQLGYILFDKLGLRALKKTKSGPSTDTSVLEELTLEHPVAEQVLGYRTLSKLKGTYADALPKLVRPDTGRIHTSFNQAVTATGRLSSSNPNLQNIPIRSDEGRRIRQAFISAPGNMLMSADYSQIELRVLAHYSGDESLMDSFRNDEDVHRRTASEIFGVAVTEVSSEMRRQAKMINFGIAYGMSPFGLSQRLRISTKTAKAAIDRYFERYSGVRRFIDEVVRKARDLGYAETLLGRRRAIPELQSRNFSIRQLGERLAINTPIQGTSADLIKKAMVDISQRLKKEKLGAQMLLQVHDELLFEVPSENRRPVEELVRHEMEYVRVLDVPLRVEIGWGANWTEAHA
ncbi:MAG TPA: DNA polymerase I [Deltaproteobacteria bacterium]|nr:DNA polymerase I [Deltaproteobacteria bacterium]